MSKRGKRVVAQASQQSGNVYQLGRPAAQAIGENMKLPSGAYDLTMAERSIAWLTQWVEPDEVLRKAGLTRAALRMLDYDDEIYQSMEQRFDTLMSRGWTLSTKKDDEATKIQGEALGHELMKVMGALLYGLFRANAFGYSVVEMVYRAPYEKQMGDTLEFGLKHAVEVPFEWFDFKGTELWHRFPEWAAVDPRKFIHAVRKPSFRNPRGEPLYSRLYWVWFFRTHGWQFWMKYLERSGIPFLVGKTAAADKVQAAQALFNAVQNAVLAIGPDDEVKALEMGRNPAIFTEFEHAVVRRIEKLILGQTLTSGIDGGGGNRSLGEVHERVSERKTNSDIDMILPGVQRVVDILCAMNSLERFRVTFNPPMQVNKDQALRDVALKEAGIVIEFSPEYLQRSYGYKKGEIIAGDKDTLPLAAAANAAKAQTGSGEGNQKGDGKPAPASGDGNAKE